jgi:hypothetical protein
LLPRNIIFELISKNGNEYTVFAKPFKKDQFAIKTGCFPLDFYDITPTPPTPPTPLSSIKSKKLSPSPTKIMSKEDSAKSKKDNIKLVKKRCPKGMVRNKITMECVSKQNKNVKQSVNIKEKSPKAKPKPEPKAKLGRCPKGTRRNPKTLLCEAKLSF